MIEYQVAKATIHPLIAAGLKYCSSCQEWKSKADFHRNNRTKDGLQPSCKVCKNWAAYLQRLRTPEKLRAQQKAWVIANSTHVRKRKADKRRLERDRLNLNKRLDYAIGYASEPQRYLSYVHKRRSLVSSCGTYTQEEWTTLCDRYGNKCLWCDSKTTLTVDHVIPLSKGGMNTISNLQPLCACCNKEKHDRTMDFRTLHNVF